MLVISPFLLLKWKLFSDAQLVGKCKGFSSYNSFIKTSQEEVWEVVAQLIGLALGILILVNYIIFQDSFISYCGSTMILLVGMLHSFSFWLQDTPGLVKSYAVLSLTWLIMRLLHLWLRYESLSVLQFNTVSMLYIS